MQGRPPRILTIYFRHQRGGLLKRFYTLVEALAARGFEVHVVSAAPLALAPRASVIAHRVWWPGVDPGGLAFWLWFTLAAPWTLLRVALAVRPRALLVFDPYYAVLGIVASACARMPIVSFVRATPWRARMRIAAEGVAWRLATALDVVGLRASAHVVTITRAMIAELAERVPGIEPRCAVLPNSLVAPPEGLPSRAVARARLCRETRWPEDALIVAAAGVLSERKNVALALEALALVPEPRVTLLVVGDGPTRQALEDRVSVLGLRSRVHFAGWIEEPLPLVLGADLFVLPSVHEGASNALLEAWGAGLPVLAARTPESVEIVGDDSLLFDGREPGDLAARLTSLARDPDALARLARASAERGRPLAFDWGDRAVALLERLLGSGPK
ncbi:MAG: glycosyltransferase [bacterium]